MGSKFVAIFTISFFFIISHTGGLQEMDLKQLNKPTNKTIYTKYGDIFDCVDIHKQPSLDHPLLQNHTLQMKPNLIPETSTSSSTHGSAHEEEEYVNFKLEDGGCPEGYVPIRRIQEKDRIRLRAHLKKYPSALNPNTDQNSGWHGASIHTKRMDIPFGAARGMLNAYNPGVTEEQHTDSLVYVQRGESDAQNAIQVGWTVFPACYGDNNVRFHTMWTADNYKKRGCIDMHCPGFVQVSKDMPLGSVLYPVSQYGGNQFYLAVAISHDQLSGNWWLIASKTVMVGYWPKEIFTSLQSYAEEAGWGGRAHNPEAEPAPPIGSGHKPDEGFGKACSVVDMQFVRSGQGSYEDLKADMLETRVDAGNDCYGVKLFMDDQDQANIFFGGPGGQCP